MSLTHTSTRRRIQLGGLWATTLMALTTFSIGAQVPTPPPPQGAPPAQGAGAGAGQGRGTLPGPGDPTGRGGNRAGGPSLGGPQMNDPAYVGVDFSKKPPVLPLSPAEEAKRFWLQPGFKMEPVLTDPDIEEAAQIAFDGNGRMFVLEIRGYMRDADGGGTLDPVGRISVHEDRDNNGTYETHKIFVDKLVFPRFVLPFGANAIITKESNADEVWKYTDTNNDGVADKKELFATGFGRLANVEHQESGLMWGMDNWLYSTVNQARLRWTPNGVLREATGANGGQWGVTQDNYGKPWFQAGASGMPGYFQLPVAYGNIDNAAERFEPNLNITWGAPVLIADMQGGLGSVRMPDGSLARSTAGAGNDVYRGDRLPKDMIGDYFYGEAVARIVRRLRPVKTEGFTQVRNVYPLSEFIRSTDPLFRPVDMTTAPDGTMYITDIYRGIIQESQWSGRGTYLRTKIEQYDLDKVVRHGRIWRLSYEGLGRRTVQPRMLNETAAQLVTHLDDPNGWWRDTAQQLLVIKQDKSVVPALKAMVRTSPNQLGKIHALWTLEGLGAADAAFVREVMKSTDAQLRQQAIRVSETLYKAGDKTFAADYKQMTSDADTEVVMQALLTLNVLKVANTAVLASTIKNANQAKGVQLVVNAILNPPAAAGGGGGFGGGPTAYTAEEQSVLERGRTIYTEVCFACHGDDGRGQLKEGTPNPMAPPLASSSRVLGHRDYVVKVLLHGMTGPLNNTTYTDMMIPMGQQTDEWVAAIGSYVRNSFGNRAPLITPADVKRVRAATSDRKTSWTWPDLEPTLPRQVVVDSTWKLTASHNSAIASYALSTQPWTSGVSQQPGMWLQVELPQAVMLTELQFDAAAVAVNPDPIVPGAPPRTGGGGGRGAAGAAAPAPPSLGFPRGYQVQVSTDGSTWSAPVAQGAATGVATTVTFPAVRAKFVRITQTGTAENTPWALLKLRLFEAGK